MFRDERRSFNPGSRMQITLFSVPYDSGRRADRMGAGPLRLLKSGLAVRLEEDGHQVTNRSVELPPAFRATEIAAAFELGAALARGVAEAVKAGTFPLVLSGNCGPAALGCVGGLQSQMNIFWFDAHGDFNTPETTRSGFLDGMALAAVTGRCWSGLAGGIPGFRNVVEGNVTSIGVRDLDHEEAAAFQASDVRRVDVSSLRTELPKTLSNQGCIAGSPAYVHLDLDVLDPVEGRMNEFAAPDGLSLDDLKWCLAQIASSQPIRAASVTAFDPASDTTGRAAMVAMAAILALVAAAAASARSYT
jgi:arginase